MILICPSCGATHSAEAWENDVKIRQALQAACALPPQVSKVVLGYLGLFRPAQRALSWSKSLKIINDLSALIAPGHIQVQGKPARPCPPHIWAMGIEQMVARTDLQRPMKNHNYLRSIVWQLADQADAGREHSQHRAELDGSARSARTTERRPWTPPADDGLSQLERQYLAKHGNLPGMEGGGITCPADLTAWAKKAFAPQEEQDATK